MTSTTECAIIQTERKRTTKKEVTTMRGIRYYVINKNTNKAVFTDYRERECRAYIETQGNKEDLVIGYKWLSI